MTASLPHILLLTILRLEKGWVFFYFPYLMFLSPGFQLCIHDRQRSPLFQYSKNPEAESLGLFADWLQEETKDSGNVSSRQSLGLQTPCLLPNSILNVKSQILLWSFSPHPPL